MAEKVATCQSEVIDSNVRVFCQKKCNMFLLP